MSKLDRTSEMAEATLAETIELRSWSDTSSSSGGVPSLDSTRFNTI